MRMRARTWPATAPRRVLSVSALGTVVLVSACSNDFDTSRQPAPRGTLGEEMYGIVCDRVGAQALHEDMTGDSFNAVCHKSDGGKYGDKVDQTKLPALADGAVDRDGKPVPLAKQQADRAYAIGRIEALAKHRADLIAALDATMPDIKVAVKDNKNADPKLSCKAPQASGERRFHDELSDMLGRFQNLYNDGTIPQSTESLARIMNAFKASPDAQASWARFDARQGYRPIEVALGAARPIVAYPNLRDLSNATLSLLSADSKPYDIEPKRDAQGNRIPIPGDAYPQFSKLLEVAHEELRNATPDAAVQPLPVPLRDPSGRLALARPRTNLETLQELFYAQDPAFGGGNSRYIVRRDPRGYVALAGGAVPPPFVDKDGDKLPDVDPLGRFVTSDNSIAPTPFFAPGAAFGNRDAAGRPLTAPTQLLYGYIDTSHTFTASLMSDMKALVNPDASQKHETLMDALSGAHVLFGTRDGSNKTSKQYAPNPALVDDWKLTHPGEAPPPDLDQAPVVVQYDAFHADTSALLDLVYALGQVLGDKNGDVTLQLVRELLVNHTADLARMTGDGLYAKGLADKHVEAKIPAKSVLWDDMIDVAVQIAQEPALLGDVMRALAADDAVPLGTIFSSFMQFNDRISYDRNNLNGPAWNFAKNSPTDMSTPVDRSKPDAGANRSAFQRFLQAIHDTNGVTACNKAGAVVHARGIPLLNTLDLPLGGGSYKECEVFKIENLAKFYLDSIVGVGSIYFRPAVLRNGILGIGAATVDVIQQSSGLEGFWDPPGSKTFRPTPRWLNRLVFFDLAGDSTTPSGPNYITNHFLSDLQGPNIGTAACPERIIDDPDPTAADASSDGKVHGLRACADGDWIFQRDKDATFVWEDFGFYKAITPLVSTFAAHKREDLFIALMEVLHKHWADDKGAPSDCKLGYDKNGQPKNCTKDGAVTYEPLLGEIFASDIMPALHQLTKTLGAMQIPQCTAADPTSHACTTTANVDGITVLANATTAMLDPAPAKALNLKDRKGNVTALRNDGTTNAQVTPIYLVLQALNAIDAQFASYAAQNPQDAGRQAQWKSARSQLVDQFLDVSAKNTTTQTFKNTAMIKFAPVLIDVLRAQLGARCPQSFTAPFTRCAWARDDVTKQMSNVIAGPTFAATVDLGDAVRKSDAARAQLELLLTYLLDAASQNDALAAVLASADDIVQLLRDDTNLVPFYKVLAEAAATSLTDKNGVVVRKSLVDANFALLAKISGKAYDKDGTTELCSSELDPNQILTVALQRLVTPMTGPDGKPTQTPLEVILDVIADVNRAGAGTASATDKLGPSDYANIADNVSDFLLDKERGLEQFYEIVRQGTVRE